MPVRNVPEEDLLSENVGLRITPKLRETLEIEGKRLGLDLHVYIRMILIRRAILLSEIYQRRDL